MRKAKVKKDLLVLNLINLFERKWFLLLLLLFGWLYVFTDKRVLNFPKYISWINFIVCILATLIFLFVRYKKNREYYRRKFRDKISLIFISLVALFWVFTFHFFLNIPVNLVIAKAADKSNYEYYDCKIIHVSTIGVDAVTFIFLNNKYSQYYRMGGYKSQEVERDYVMRLKVKKSILNAYYLINIELVKKE